MDAEHAQAEDLADVQQMAQIGPRKMAASEAIAIVFDGPEVGLVGTAFDANAAFASEGGSIPGDFTRAGRG